MVMRKEQKQRMFLEKGSVKVASVVIVVVVIFGIKTRSLTSVGIIITNIIVKISFGIIFIFIKIFVGIEIFIFIKIVIIIILKDFKSAFDTIPLWGNNIGVNVVGWSADG